MSTYFRQNLCNSAYISLKWALSVCFTCTLSVFTRLVKVCTCTCICKTGTCTMCRGHYEMWYAAYMYVDANILKWYGEIKYVLTNALL